MDTFTFVQCALLIVNTIMLFLHYFFMQKYDKTLVRFFESCGSIGEKVAEKFVVEEVESAAILEAIDNGECCAKCRAKLVKASGSFSLCHVCTDELTEAKS